MSLLNRSVLPWVAVAALSAATTTTGCGDSFSNSGGSNGPGGASDGASETPGLGSCRSDKDCRDADGICDTSRLVCVECLSTTDCGEGAICKNTSCVNVTTCNSSKDCPVDTVCSDALAYCVECDANADCDDGVCLDNQCLPACASDKDCGGDTVCNLERGACFECVQSDDCSDGSYCNASGACEAQVCAPGAAICRAETLTLCNASGSGFAQTSCESCASDGMSCDDGCTEGEEGCTCYGNGTCNSGLACLSDLCVDDGGGGGGTNGTGGQTSSGGTSSSGGSSSSSDGCGSPRIIDDMEDGDNWLCEHDGRNHRWYWIGSDSVTRDPATDPVGTLLSPARGSSTRGLQFAASGVFNDLNGIGTDLYQGGVFDASGYSAIGFWAKGAFSTPMTVALHTNYTLPPENGGSCDVACWRGYLASVNLTASWQYFEIPLEDFEPQVGNLIDTSDLRGLMFLFGSDFSVTLDDIEFID